MELSIVVPIYNVKDFLEDCLFSILNQTNNLQDTEVILIDDGSTDGSSQIASEFALKHADRFKYFYKTNGGLSDARNFGIKKANGNYLMFVDSDDVISLKACEKIIETVKKQKVDMIEFNFALFNKEIESSNPFFTNRSSSYISKKSYLLDPPCAWNKVIRRDIFISNDMTFPIGLWYEDRYLTPQYVNYVENIYYLDEILYFYRQRVGSITKQLTFNSKMLNIFDVLNKVYVKLDKKEYFDEIEYIYINDLLISTSISMLKVKRVEYIYDINTIMREKFPNWKNNIYFKAEYSFPKKVFAFLIYGKHYKLAEFIISINLRLKQKI